MENRYSSLGKYLLLKTLGDGYNAKVKLGYDPTNSQYVAIKIMKPHAILNSRLIKKEIEILSNLKHPNIVNLIEFYDSAEYVKKNGETYKTVAILMELVPNGELFDYVFASGSFSEETARTYFRIIIETLEYCHTQGIAHRDLKPENLLFDVNFNLKIADFGYATLWAGDDNTGQLHTWLGTEAYMAPEIHLRKPYNGPSVDIFAVGMILFIMYNRNPPFGKAVDSDPFYKLFCTNRVSFWSNHKRNKPEGFFSEDFKDLIGAMLSQDPNNRATIEQIKAHPWYNAPIGDIDKLKLEFIERKKKVFANLEQQKAAKKNDKLMAKMKAHQNQAIFTGIKPFRSLEIEGGEYLSKELEAKVNFETKRELQEYQAEGVYKAFTQVFTVMSPDFIFKLLCSLCQTCLKDFSVAKDKYKIKGQVNKDEGTCALDVVLTKVDESTTCIEFRKKAGNIMVYYKVVDEIKKKLPIMECDEEKTEEIQ